MSRQNEAALQWLICLGCRVFGGILCALVAIRGVYALWATDLREDVVLELLYCLLPAANVIAFLGIRRGLLRGMVQAVLLGGFIVVYAALNWRMCSALGYCTTLNATIWMTFRTPAVVQMCEGLLLSVAVAWLEERPLTKTERPA